MEGLYYFKDIFERRDFSFISNPKNIESVSRAIRNLYFLAGEEEKNLIGAYLQNLTAFHNWLETKDKDIREGYTKASEALGTVINIIKGNSPVSRGYLRKFSKNLLYGLNRIYAALILVFRSPNILQTNINSQQMARFIINSNIGCTKNYSMNIAGGFYSFRPHLKDLTRNELAKVIFTLENKIVHKMINGWTIMGEGSGPNDIRIHALTRMIGKTKLYRLYRVNGGEHRIHEQHAREINPKNCRFEAAA